MSTSTENPSEESGSKSSALRLCITVENAKNSMLNALDQAKREIEEAYAVFLNEMKSTESTSSEVTIESFQSGVLKSKIDDFDVIVGFKNSLILYTIELKYLRRYPSNIIYKNFIERKNLRDDGIVLLDHDDTLFPVVLSYLRQEKINYNDLGETYLSQLCDDLDYYGLPIPIQLRCLESQQNVKRCWSMSKLLIELDGVTYTIDREKLFERGIRDSLFNHTPPSSMSCNRGDKVLKWNESHPYFHYVAQYIDTGHLEVEDPSDLKYIDRIRQEFSSLNINIRETEWRHFLPLSSYFPDSKILTDEHIEILTEWLGEDKRWNLLYQGSRDGFGASNFHSKCDGKGATVTIIQNNDNNMKNIFGGYSSKSWLSNHTYNYDEDAFIFSLKNPFNIVPTRLSCICPSKATFNHSSYGPLFGYGNDIAIANNCNRERGGWINCPGTKGYENRTEKGSSLFVNTAGPTEGNFFTVDEIEVYGL